MADQQKAPAYQWFPRDFAMDEVAQLMNYEQQGMYRKLLDHQWLEGSIPADEVELAALLKVPVARFRKLWPRIARKFAPCGPGRLQNGRLERQRTERQQFTESPAENVPSQAVLAGRASAASRRLKHGTAQPVGGGRRSVESPNGVRESFDERFGPPFDEPFGDSLGEPFGERTEPNPNSASASASSSATSNGVRGDQRGDQPADRARVVPIGPVHRSDGALSGSLPKDHLRHAKCSPDLMFCVPEAVHAKLRGLLAPRFGGDMRRSSEALKAFYDRVWKSLPQGFVPPSDAFRFWGQRFDAEFATPVETPKAAPVPTGPAAWRGCSTHQPPCQSASEHSRRDVESLKAQAQ